MEKSQFNSGTVTTTVKIVDDGTDLSLQPAVSTTAWTDYRNGSSNPNYRKIIRQGNNATTEYLCDTKKFNSTSIQGGTTVTNPFSGARYTVDYKRSGLLGPNPYDPIDTGTSSADSIARQQFVSRYRSRRTQFQTGVALGELREVVEMIRSPAKALRDGIDSYYGTVKKRLRKSKNRKRTIQDTWLEYSFGWVPLVNDVKNVCKLATADPFRVFEKLTGKGDVVDQNVLVPESTGYGVCQINYNVVRKSSVTVVYKGAIRAENSPPSFPEQLGLSWSNLLPTVWELIPYSFLVDYFTNVGVVIDGISTGTISLAWGCRSQIHKSTTSIGGVALNYDHLQTSLPFKWTGSGYASGGGLCSTRFRYIRSLIDSVSVGFGDFSFRLPGSDTKWLNIAALARLRQ
jgi:hypothetical protein